MSEATTEPSTEDRPAPRAKPGPKPPKVPSSSTGREPFEVTLSDGEVALVADLELPDYAELHLTIREVVADLAPAVCTDVADEIGHEVLARLEGYADIPQRPAAYF